MKFNFNEFLGSFNDFLWMGSINEFCHVLKQVRSSRFSMHSKQEQDKRKDHFKSKRIISHMNFNNIKRHHFRTDPAFPWHSSHVIKILRISRSLWPGVQHSTYISIIICLGNTHAAHVAQKFLISNRSSPISLWYWDMCCVVCTNKLCKHEPFNILRAINVLLAWRCLGRASHKTILKQF